MTSPTAQTKPRLLVVDDEPLGCRTMKAVFARKFEVETALSVAEAVKNFDLKSFDAALVDYHMPGDTGLVLIEKMKHFLPKERLFLTTADDSLEHLGAGRYTYAGKPLNFMKFIAMLTETVMASRGQSTKSDASLKETAPEKTTLE